jgi:Predicted Zn-dependent peptidases
MIQTKIFPCGLRFAFRRTKSPVAYSALTILSGTRNEPEHLCGIAHMTEHMLFKGTARRTPSQINNRLERLGGELNAYTTKEETVIYSTVLKEDAPKAVDLLFELAFTSTFPEKELVKERSVVIDEINMYKDSPAECIYDDFEELLFGEHPLSRTILGSSKTLKKMTSEDLRQYVSENFTPDRMCISIVGNMTPQRAEKLVQQAIDTYLPAAFHNGTDVPKAEAPKTEQLRPGAVFTKEVSKHNHQVNCIIGTTAPSLYDRRRLTMVLLANILGGPSSNSRLNQTLREKNALVYNIDCSYSQFADSGSVMIGFGCEKGHLEKCLELTRKEIANLRDNALSDRALRDAKKQLLGQNAISSDNGEAQSLAMGKSLLVFGNIPTDEEIRSQIGAITSEDIKQLAAEVFAEERLSTLIYR